MGQTELQVLIGLVASFVIQWLKKASWFPVLTEQSDKILKVVFSALVAAGSAIAVSFSFDPTLGQLTVTGLTWANVVGGLQAFLIALLAQQFGYRALIKPVPEGN